MRCWIISLVLSLVALPAFCQSGPELDALLEAFFAKDLATVLRYLPPETAEVIKQLPDDAKQEVAERYLLAAQAQFEGVKFSQPGNGVVLAMDRAIGADGVPSEHAEVYIDKYLSGNGETMIRFRVSHSEVTAYWPDSGPTVWMRLVDGDWRVYEIDTGGREIRFDDPMYLTYLKRPRPTRNESSAIMALRTINTALVIYSSTFPDIGFPESLQVLGLEPKNSASAHDNDETPSGGTRDHAGLLDDTLSTPPFEQSGYRFVYQRDSEGRYSVVAHPLKYGTTGTQSFFTNETGVIRQTSEDRDPTADDDPLQ